MRASSDWRSARYLAAQRASKARRAVRDVEDALHEMAEADYNTGRADGQGKDAVADIWSALAVNHHKAVAEMVERAVVRRG